MKKEKTFKKIPDKTIQNHLRVNRFKRHFPQLRTISRLAWKESRTHRRSPLTPIKGPLEDQLNSEAISKNDRKNLQIARTNTNRFESLVEQLLHFQNWKAVNPQT